MKKIGILALQGALEEHETALKNAAEKLGKDIEIIYVNRKEQIKTLDAIILPGGESTSMRSIGRKLGIFDPLKEKIQNGMPVLGTCAGTILLSSKVKRKKDAPATDGVIGLLDITVIRNGYGRQRESFETDLQIHELDANIKGIFIRAPIIEKTGEKVKVLAKVDNNPVLVEQNNIIGATFHPELSGSTLIHEYFLNKI